MQPVQKTFVPLDSLRFEKPDDGLPVMEDWITTFELMLLSGIELQREPLDCTMGLVQAFFSDNRLSLCLLVQCCLLFVVLMCFVFVHVLLLHTTVACDHQTVDQIKGWTRSSVIALI